MERVRQKNIGVKGMGADVAGEDDIFKLFRRGGREMGGDNFQVS